MIPQKPFYIMRHGQSEANAAGLFAGHLDTPLTDQGRAEAEAARTLLAQLPMAPERVLSSPLTRAYDTAAIVNTHLGLPHMVHQDLREINMGIWEGTPFLENGQRFFEGMDPPEGETHIAFKNRVQRALTYTLETDPRLPLIVCHGGFIFKIATLYDRIFPRVRNAQLYFFEPLPSNSDLPWRIYDVTPQGLKPVEFVSEITFPLRPAVSS
jgi:glucosyl-3-phosphoglycerate phosphatase